MASESHYFDVDPHSESAPATVPLVLPDLHVELSTDSGVFSPRRIDPGTKYLLLEAPAPDGYVRNALDLGCGYGAMARVLAHRAPAAHVWAVDVNARARALAAKNLSGCRATVASPEEVPADLEFDLIWSNPPIRIGKSALHDLLEEWLARLARGGLAVLVVQRHLGADTLHRWLESHGFEVQRIGSRRGYRLLEVRRPDPRP